MKIFHKSLAKLKVLLHLSMLLYYRKPEKDFTNRYDLDDI